MSADRAAGQGAGNRATLGASARRIAQLAWPVYVGQMSVVAFSVIDTLLVARFSTPDLAALAVGSATYMTVFIGLMGVVLGLSPIVGQHFGAGRRAEAGSAALQAVWLALLLAVPGSLLLLFPMPILALAQLDAAVELKVRGYLQVLACSLPGSLLFTVYRGFNNAVSRPKAVMVLQLGALAAKLPLSMALLNGLPGLGLPAFGVVGCALATALCMWAQVLVALWLVRRDAFYAPFRLESPGLPRPDPAALRALLKLGGPIGMATLIEVSGFTLMAIFIARLGTEAVAAHQIAANMVGISFMIPLALANATSTLVAQQVGARDYADAKRLGWHGLQLGSGVAAVVGLLIFAARRPAARPACSSRWPARAGS
jgi:multidrug resistance protein, MATE family